MNKKKTKRVSSEKRRMALAVLSDAQDEIMSVSSAALKRLRSSGCCTVGAVASILVKRDEALAEAERNFHAALSLSPKRRPKTKPAPKPKLKPKSKPKKVKPKVKRIVKSKEEVADAKRQSSRQSYQSLRLQVIQHYGGLKPKCVFCGSKRLPFYLQHTNNNGFLLRLEVAGYGFSGRYNVSLYYRWLIAQHYPEAHNQVVLCNTCFKLLVNRRGWYFYFQDHLGFGSFMSFNPEVLSAKAHKQWNELVTNYCRSCISLWERYLNATPIIAAKHLKSKKHLLPSNS